MTTEADGKPSDAGADTTAAAPKPKKEKKAPANLVIPPKKPKLTKAERRALQEQQRAAKSGTAGDDGGSVNASGGSANENASSANVSAVSNVPAQSVQKGEADKSKPASGSAENAAGDVETSKQIDKTVELFSHLPPYRGPPSRNVVDQATSTLHPAVLELGMEYATGAVRGGNARCRRMLQVFSDVMEDYVPPPESDFRHHFLQEVLKPSFTYWTQNCRPHSVSMGNAFTFCKSALQTLSRDMPYDQAKMLLQDSIEQYMTERMEYANQAIAQHALQKIEQEDVILTFGHSEAIQVLLETAQREEKDFFVWVVDARPLWEGKTLLAKLRNADIRCGYINLNALTYVMNRVTKVFLGASALMTNGAVYGRVGTAAVALMAKDHHIPVLVCCETYKISNKVQLESITANELGDPDALLQPNHSKMAPNNASALSSISVTPVTPEKEAPTNNNELDNWRDIPNLKLLHLLYDVTPAEFVSGIVTEVGIIPTTSVAVLLREMNPQDATFEL